jgi:hypothetical protein
MGANTTAGLRIPVLGETEACFVAASSICAALRAIGHRGLLVFVEGHVLVVGGGRIVVHYCCYSDSRTG